MQYVMFHSSPCHQAKFKSITVSLNAQRQIQSAFVTVPTGSIATDNTTPKCDLVLVHNIHIDHVYNDQSIIQHHPAFSLGLQGSRMAAAAEEELTPCRDANDMPKCQHANTSSIIHSPSCSTMQRG
jgi:hypothetical protein